MRPINPNPESLFPAPRGAFSHGTLVPEGSKLLYLSGQVGVRPDGSTPSGPAEQASLVWENLAAVLEEAGMGFRDLVKMTVYIVDEEAWTAFAADRPRRFEGRFIRCPGASRFGRCEV